MKRQLISLTLALTMAAGSVGIVGAQGGTKTVAFNDKNVVLRFGALSDVHQDGSANSDPEKKFRKALSTLYKESDEKLDAILVAGDLTDSATDAQIKQFKTVVEDNLPSSVNFVFSLGNHDSSGGSKAKAFRDGLGDRFYAADVDQDAIAKANRHAVIGGYNFLAIEIEGYWDQTNHCTYKKADKEWLDKKLEELTKKEPNKPIFLATHAMIYGTAYGSELPGSGTQWYTKQLTDILKKYPQVVTFGGHVHHPLNDERSIMQTDFTSLGCGSVRYMAIEGGYTQTGSGTVPNDANAFSQGLYIEVDNNNNIRFNRMDFYNNRTIKESWVIPGPNAQKSHLSYYGWDRANTNTAPYFEDSAKMTAEMNSAKGALVKFDAAKDNDMVHHYDVELVRQGETAPEKTVKTLSGFYNTTAPTKFSIPLAGLSLGATYTVNVYAVDSWGARSVPRSQALTVPGGGVDRDRLVADLFNLRFNESGKPYDISDAAHAIAGSTATTKDASKNSYIYSFDGKAANVASINLKADEKKKVEDGFTATACFKLNRMTDQYLIDGNGFALYFDGATKSVAATVNVGGKNVTVKGSEALIVRRYYEAAVSFDGKKVQLFLNGEKAGEADAVGKVGGVADTMTIGGRPAAAGDDKNLVGNIYKARLFASSLDLAHMSELHDMLEKDETVVTLPDTYVDIDFAENGKISDSKGNATFEKNGAATIGSAKVNFNDKEYTASALSVTASGGNVMGTFSKLDTPEKFSSFIKQGMTIEAFAVNRAATGTQGIFCATQSGGYGLATSAGKPYALVHTGGYIQANATAVASSKNLTHYVASFDFANSEVRLYVNGALAATGDLTGDYVNSPEKCFNKFALGADTDENGGGTDFPMTNFTMVDAKVYNAALTDRQAGATFKNAKTALGVIDIPVYTLGDVNESGDVTSLDALWVLENVADLRKLTDVQQMAADVDGNGKVNGVDALNILQKVAGLPSSF